MNSHQPQSTKTGMIGGLLFVLVGLSVEEVLKTTVLAAIGASVSFLVTLGFKWIVRYFKRRTEKGH
jgi:uncharacterized membrane protein